MRTSKILSLSLPPEMLREAERAAKREGRTKSELFREALRRYLLEEKVRRLQEYGARQARAVGITPSQVDQLIQEDRGNR